MSSNAATSVSWFVCGFPKKFAQPAPQKSPPAGRRACPVPPRNIEDMDFLQTKPLRYSIHQREGGRCFYCLRRVNKRTRCLDQVVPRVSSGGNSYRNLVSCCGDCNMKKWEHSAEEHLRTLYRERRLGDAELNARLRALDDLAAGKLKPLTAWPRADTKVKQGMTDAGRQC